MSNLWRLINPNIFGNAISEGIDYGLQQQERKRQEAREDQQRQEANFRQQQLLAFQGLQGINPDTALGSLGGIMSAKEPGGLANVLSQAGPVARNANMALAAKARELEAEKAKRDAYYGVLEKNPELASAGQLAMQGRGEKEVLGPGGLMMLPKKVGPGFDSALGEMGSLAQRLQEQEAERKYALEGANRLSREKIAAENEATQRTKERRELEADIDRGAREEAARELEKIPLTERTDAVLADLSRRILAAKKAGLTRAFKPSQFSASLEDRKELENIKAGNQMALLKESLKGAYSGLGADVANQALQRLRGGAPPMLPPNPAVDEAKASVKARYKAAQSVQEKAAIVKGLMSNPNDDNERVRIVQMLEAP